MCRLLMPQKSLQVDQPMAALLADLKQRGMLDDTLILWCTGACGWALKLTGPVPSSRLCLSIPFRKLAPGICRSLGKIHIEGFVGSTFHWFRTGFCPALCVISAFTNHSSQVAIGICQGMKSMFRVFAVGKPPIARDLLAGILRPT